MLAMSLPGAARAIGLGEIRVDSALNEPLSARIDIVGATREDLAVLTATVANRELFQRYGAERPSFLASATFKVGADGHGRPVLFVRSTDAFTDPVVSLLVDLRWGKNEVVREYSLLLDPPGYAAPQGAPDTRLAAAAPGPAAAPPSAPAAPAFPSAPGPAVPQTAALPSATTQTRSAARSPTAAHDPYQASASMSPTGQSRHKVAAGATLRAVARKAGARTEANVQRMMIALFRANPGAFEGNINRLHRDAMLTFPTDAELDAIPAADAKREVRAQMLAWRLDGRQSAPTQRVAASPAPGVAPAAAAAASDAEASLKARVQSLEQSLDDVHKQLASDTAKIQTLNQAATNAQAATTAHAASSTPAATTAPAKTTAPAATPAIAPRAELVTQPIVAAAPAETRSRPASAPARPAPKPVGHVGLIATLAILLALLAAGLAFFRRRLSQAPASNDWAETSVEDLIPSPTPQAPDVPVPHVAPAMAAAAIAGVPAPGVPAPATAPQAMPSMEPSFQAPAIEPAKFETAKHVASVTSVSAPNSDRTTLSLEIDIEALERSYLDSLPLESTAIDTVAIDASELESALQADLNAVVLDAKELAAKVDRNELDFDLMDLDAAPQHVQMPSALHDAPVAQERRVNIVDVLKMAIDRDPHRSDLRMKLLETYYSVAATNQRAFVDGVRKLSRDSDKLSPEEWNKVRMMGRQIAADDILFADPAQIDDDLANCA
jgi:pilus assembly protein FimV